MKIITFQDRYPMPKAVAVGMASDQNVEAVRFALPQIHGEQRAYVYLTIPTSDGSRHDVVELVKNQLVISGELAAIGGSIQGYAEIQDPDGVMLWHSDVFTLEVRALNDVTGEIEKEFPTALQQAMAKTAEDRAAAKQAMSDASNAANLAKTSEINAAQSAINVGLRVDEAINAAESAVDAASSASESKLLSQAHAAAAAKAKSDAFGYVSIAANFSDNAKTSMEAAKSAQGAAEEAKMAAEAAREGVNAAASDASASAASAAQSANAAANAAETVRQAADDGVRAVLHQQEASEHAINDKADEQLARIPEVAALAESVADISDLLDVKEEGGGEVEEKVITDVLVGRAYVAAGKNTITFSTSTTSNYIKIPVDAGEKYHVYGAGYNVAYGTLWVIADVTGNNMIQNCDYESDSHTSISLIDDIVTIPDGGKYLYVNGYSGSYLNKQAEAYIVTTVKGKKTLGNFVGTDNIEDSAITPEKLSKKVNPVFHVGANREYKTLKSGIEAAVLFENATLFVDEGVYNVLDEFGASIFESMTSSERDNLGYNIGNGLRIVFSPKSKVVCNYEGDNNNVKMLFSVFNAYYPGGFTIDGLNAEAKNIRYIIHEDLAFFESGPRRLEHRNVNIKNCKFYFDNKTNNTWSNHGCIGGGLSYAETAIIKNCVFETTAHERSASLVGGAFYHGNGNNASRSVVICKDCYFVNPQDTFYVYSITTIEPKDFAVAIVCNNSMIKEPFKRVDDGKTDSILFHAWNNGVKERTGYDDNVENRIKSVEDEMRDPVNGLDAIKGDMSALQNDDKSVNAGKVWTATANGAEWKTPTGSGGISYSYEEFDTGKTWLDGKKIYAKVVDCGNLPNKETSSIRVAIDGGFSQILSVSGYGNSGNYIFPLPLPSPSAPIIVYMQRYSSSQFDILIQTTTDRSAMHAYLTVEYTK